MTINTFTSLPREADEPIRNDALIVALALDRRPQWQIAAAAGISPSLLSMFANGHRDPDKTQAEHVAAELGITQLDKLFQHIRRAGDS